MKSICSILEEAATEAPSKPLFVFPETRWHGEEILTYGDLAARCGAAAGVLSQHARPGDRALLLFPTGPAFWEAFMGCLAAGVIAVPVGIPSFNRGYDSLQLVCRDCDPSVLLTDEDSAELLNRRREKHPYLGHLPVISPNHWRRERGEFACEPLESDAVAFLQYTSGSTSHPKGVQVSHSNLLANLEMIQGRMEIEKHEGCGVTWLPHYHDMGLVGGYLVTLYSTNTIFCLPPEEIALSPERWLRLISENRARVSGAPDFAYRACAESISDEQMQGVDLSSWRVAAIGAERIRPESMQLFADRFSPYGFRDNAFFPCYGLGEATLMATGGPATAVPVVRRVSAAALKENRIASPASDADCTELAGSGGTFAGSRIVILHPESAEPLADDQIGEVLLCGPSVTRGYFNKSELNDQLFRDLLIDGQPKRFLQTGDLGFLSGGELFITGRAKEMMIVRGRNLYPEDIEEQTYQAHEALATGRAVAFSVTMAGQESLVIAAELKRSAMKLEAPEAVISAIRYRVNEESGVNPAEILLLRPGSIPRTSSGKPQRLSVRSRYLDGTIKCLFREHG